jgi:hypothetical protein
MTRRNSGPCSILANFNQASSATPPRPVPRQSHDVAVGAVEVFAALREIPPQGRDPPLQGGDGIGFSGYRPGGAGGDIEPEHLRVGRQGGQAVPARPAGKMAPVGSVGFSGIFGGGGLGVVAGGFGEVLQPPWQAGSGGGMRRGVDRAVRGRRLAGSGVAWLRRRGLRRGGVDLRGVRTSVRPSAGSTPESAPCPIMQSYRTGQPGDGRGGLRPLD